MFGETVRLLSLMKPSNFSYFSSLVQIRLDDFDLEHQREAQTAFLRQGMNSAVLLLYVEMNCLLLLFHYMDNAPVDTFAKRTCKGI